MRTMNQSHNENRYCFSGFKTLLASISCLVCLQALGDCPILTVNTEQKQCIMQLKDLKGMEQGEVKENMKQIFNDGCTKALTDAQKQKQCNTAKQRIENLEKSLKANTPSDCPNGYLKKIWNKFCDTKKGTKLTVIDHTTEDTVYSCSDQVCEQLHSIKENADGTYCQLKNLQTDGENTCNKPAVTIVTQNDNTVSATVCGKTKKLNITSFGSRRPSC